MTIDDIMHAAAQHGFNFEIACQAVNELMDEQRCGERYWSDLGSYELLRAVEAADNPVEYTYQQQVTARTVRV